jgi:hypothetical protein
VVTSNASAQKKKWGASNDDTPDAGAPAGTAATADADNIAAASQGRATRLGKFKSLIDMLLAQLSFSCASSQKGSQLAGRGAGKTSFTRPNTVSNAPSSIGKGHERPGSTSGSRAAGPGAVRRESFDRPPSTGHRPGSSGNAGSGMPFGDALVVSPAAAPPPVGLYHLALFGRLLGIFPAPVVVDRPAIHSIATLMLVHLTSHKLNLRRVYDGRPSIFNNATEPTVREVQPALAEALYGATTSSVPSARADSGGGFSTVSVKKVISMEFLFIFIYQTYI